MDNKFINDEQRLTIKVLFIRSVWLAQLVKSLAAPVHGHLSGGSLARGFSCTEAHLSGGSLVLCSVVRGSLVQVH